MKAKDDAIKPALGKVAMLEKGELALMCLRAWEFGTEWEQGVGMDSN